MNDRVALVWHESLMDYHFGDNHALQSVRLDLTMRLASTLGLLDDIEILSPKYAADVDLERAHSARYLAAVRAATPTTQSVEYGLGTEDNPVFEHMHQAAALVVGASLTAASQIAFGYKDRAVNLAGGWHHAMTTNAAGFCIYNDCAIAISWLLDNGFSRIVYLDVDVHHGDGVQAAFYDDPRVLTISVHQHPLTLWPGTGYPQEIGVGAAQGTSVNVALPPGSSDGDWLRAFHAVVPPLLREFQPEILVTQCGVDTHQEDPLAQFCLSVDGHLAIYRTLRELADRYAKGKWLVLGGGGYSPLKVVPRSWTHLLATVVDRDLDPNQPIPIDWTAHVTSLWPTVSAPVSMTDGHDSIYIPWNGVADSPVDVAIRDSRRAVFPLHGLDPDDPNC